jgi:hypothetical protein
MITRVLIILAGILSIGSVSAEDTICAANGGAFISKCGKCPAGATVLSGPNIHNGRECEGDPTVRRSVSAEQAQRDRVATNAESKKFTRAKEFYDKCPDDNCRAQTKLRVVREEIYNLQMEKIELERKERIEQIERIMKK